MKGFVALTKPRIIELLLITTLPTMIVARRGVPSGWLMLATLAGGALSAGGANATTCSSTGIDAVMKRTSKRPLVTGAVSPAEALCFAVGARSGRLRRALAVVNLLSAVLALSAALFYVFVYTIALKRRSSQNIVIGGAAGAVPVLVGWAAVTDRLGLAARGPLHPHRRVDAVALLGPRRQVPGRLRRRRRADAAGRGVLRAGGAPIIVYSVALVGCRSAFASSTHLGWVYWGVSLPAGALYLLYAFRLRIGGTPKAAMALFKYSITYVTVIFAAMAVDTLVRYH